MAARQSAPLSPFDVLQAALRREKSSYAFYDGLLRRSSTVDFLSDLLEELRDAEFHHIKMIEKKIAGMERG